MHPLTCAKFTIQCRSGINGRLQFYISQFHIGVLYQYDVCPSSTCLLSGRDSFASKRTRCLMATNLPLNWRMGSTVSPAQVWKRIGTFTCWTIVWYGTQFLIHEVCWLLWFRSTSSRLALCGQDWMVLHGKTCPLCRKAYARCLQDFGWLCLFLDWWKTKNLCPRSVGESRRPARVVHEGRRRQRLPSGPRSAQRCRHEYDHRRPVSPCDYEKIGAKNAHMLYLTGIPQRRLCRGLFSTSSWTRNGLSVFELKYKASRFQVVTPDVWITITMNDLYVLKLSYMRRFDYIPVFPRYDTDVWQKGDNVVVRIDTHWSSFYYKFMSIRIWNSQSMMIKYQTVQWFEPGTEFAGGTLDRHLLYLDWGRKSVGWMTYWVFGLRTIRIQSQKWLADG